MAKNYEEEFKDLIQSVLREQASDLHISVGKNPTLRIAGQLTPLVNKSVVTPEDAQGLVWTMLKSQEDREKFKEEKELDFAYSFGDKARFRVNTYFERGFMAAALRLIPTHIKTLKELNLPDALGDFARREQGFFLVVGPTGQGKTTTLAALVNIINNERAEHILTIEDPIEYLIAPGESLVDQREVGTDTKDFKHALRSMFREDINVAMIGEMRDYEAISAAVTAAETGHLILSSLHTNNAAQSIDRIIDSFPGSQQNQIRSQLSSTLIGIFSQRLLPRFSGGLIPAYEILIATTAIKNLIRENKNHEIDLVIETSAEQGMVSFNQSLANLVRQGEVSFETALSFSLNPRELETIIERR